MSSNFFGSGVGYPVQFGTSGGIRGSAGVQRIAESIRIILGTQYGERVMRPRFGCNLKSLVFAPNNEATANLARYYVQQGLSQWEPRIEVFAGLVEGLTYRLNRVPEKNYIAFLNLLGITRDPAVPAHTFLTFTVLPSATTPILVPRKTQAHTQGSESEAAIVFETDEDVS